MHTHTHTHTHFSYHQLTCNPTGSSDCSLHFQTHCVCVCVPVREVRRATVEDVAGYDMLMQAAHGGNVGRSNEIHDAVTYGQDTHALN